MVADRRDSAGAIAAKRVVPGGAVLWDACTLRTSCHGQPARRPLDHAGSNLLADRLEHGAALTRHPASERVR
jgi:hypothetical protein